MSATDMGFLPMGHIDPLLAHCGQLLNEQADYWAVIGTTMESDNAIDCQRNEVFRKPEVCVPQQGEGLGRCGRDLLNSDIPQGQYIDDYRAPSQRTRREPPDTKHRQHTRV